VAKNEEKAVETPVVQNITSSSIKSAVIPKSAEKPAIDPALAGEYELVHGNYVMGAMVYGPGTILSLTAEDAARMLDTGVIARVGS